MRTAVVLGFLALTLGCSGQRASEWNARGLAAMKPIQDPAITQRILESRPAPPTTTAAPVQTDADLVRWLETGEARNPEATHSIYYRPPQVGRDDMIPPRYQEAVEAFSKAADLAPGVAEYHANLGDAYLGLRLTDQAARCFRKALDLDAGHVRAARGLSIATAAMDLRRVP